MQRGGKAGAGSGLGKGFGSSKGFASPGACLDGSRNTALKEKRLLDSLEKVSFQPLGKTVRGQELRQKKGCCSFSVTFRLSACCFVVRLLFVFLQLRKTPRQSVCCGWESGFRSASCLSHAASTVVREPEECKGCLTGLFAFLLPRLSCQGNTKQNKGNELGVGKLLVKHLRARFTEGRWSLGWVLASCEQVRRLYFNKVVEIMERFQRRATKMIRFGEWTLQCGCLIVFWHLLQHGSSANRPGELHAH